jgi:hypothetical protein
MRSARVLPGVVVDELSAHIKAHFRTNFDRDTVLSKLVRQGAIESNYVMAPNKTGRLQKQVLWRLVAA